MEKPTFKEEKILWKKHYQYVIGVDEVGRGAFAGPVVAGAVVFKRNIKFKNKILSQINDSKQLSAKKREILSKAIKKEAFLYGISIIEVHPINKIGIEKTTRIAIRKVINSVSQRIFNLEKNYNSIFVLADGFHVRYIRGIGLVRQKAIIKGDTKSMSIAAASIIAKVYRDDLMKNLDKKYPGYKFSKNKGYGTKEHREALKKYGLSKIHRTSFNLSKYIS